LITYDNANRPSTAIDGSNGITYATGFKTSPGGTCLTNVTCYTPQGSVYAVSIGQSSSFTGGLNITDSYNNRLQPNEFKASSTGGNAIDISYSFLDPLQSNKNAGHVFSITNNLDTTRSQSFTYDQLNRITSALTTSTYSTSPAHCWGENYSVDTWGNLQSISATTVSGYTGCTQESGFSTTPNGNNHLPGFSYDSSGNTSNDGTYGYGWDGESQLKSSTYNSATTDYIYDGDGRRVAKANSSNVPYKLYWYGSGGEILAETDGSGNNPNEYVFFGGKRIAMLPTGSTAQFYVEDSLGTSRIITNNTGVVCYDADFYPYGGERAYTDSCTQNNYKFEGKERDTETLNDDFGARYYSNRFGRWLSADWSNVPTPVPYANLTNPQTLNLYSMVADDPESFADLDGHSMPTCGYDGDWCVASETDNTKAQQENQEKAKNAANANTSQSIDVRTYLTDPAQNRQPDGSYKATPDQLAKIKEAADKKTTIGDGECVTACKRFTGVPGPTTSWEGGKPASELTDKDKGTAIATFIQGSDGKWHYLPDSGGHKNSGTFMGTSTKGTFWMADQWPQGKPVSIWNVGSNPDNASMNAASYRVIIVPNP